VKYQVLDSMLLNESQRQQRQITTLTERNRNLEERASQLEAAIKDLVNSAPQLLDRAR
jgi:cell division protein FtsB